MCQFTKQRLTLPDFLSALDSGHIVSSRFRVRHWSDAVEKTFVITRNDTITCLFVYLEYILNRSQQHLLILSLYMVFTQLNMICANLLDNYYDSMARLAAF